MANYLPVIVILLTAALVAVPLFRGLLSGLFFTHLVNLIDGALFQKLLLVVVLSMLVTPVIADLAHRLAAMPGDLKEATREAPARTRIVVAGFGRVG